MEVILLQQAKALGLKRYFTGEPCIRGHIDERKVLDRSCVICNREKTRARADKIEAWRQANLEKDKANKHAYYLNNKERFETQRDEWKAENPERLRELKNNYRRSEKGVQQSRDWIDTNRDKHKKTNSASKKKHVDRVRSETRTRQARKLHATPDWLTPEDHEAIRSFYTEAVRREKETGIKHHVDHQIPLQGRNVCGLHVPWNLNVLTEAENLKKGLSYNDGA